MCHVGLEPPGTTSRQDPGRSRAGRVLLLTRASRAWDRAPHSEPYSSALYPNPNPDPNPDPNPNPYQAPHSEPYFSRTVVGPSLRMKSRNAPDRLQVAVYLLWLSLPPIGCRWGPRSQSTHPCSTPTH